MSMVMDDCNLKSLKVKPGQLSPIFKPDTVVYKATVGSRVTTITILCETSDRNATVSISVSINWLCTPVAVGLVLLSVREELRMAL